MKVCLVCCKRKPVREYYTRATNKDGLELRCKPCYIEYVHNSTPKKLVNSIYRDQKRASKKRSHSPPGYTADELFEWVILKAHFKKLWEDWVKSDRMTNLRPSIDRIDNDLPYGFDNIRLVTWGENFNKACLVDRKNKSIASSRPVRATSLIDGSINEFISAGQASRMTNTNQSNLIAVANKAVKIDRRGNSYIPKSSGGFVWEWIQQKGE